MPQYQLKATQGDDGKLHVDAEAAGLMVQTREEWEAMHREWAATQRDATRFLVIMCAVCGVTGFLVSFVVCVLTGV